MVNGTTEAKALRVAALCISLFLYLHTSVSAYVKLPLQNMSLKNRSVP